MASTIDLLPTIVHFVGANLPKDRVIDGMNMADHLTGKSKEPFREEFYYFSEDTIGAVRWKNWKLMLEKTKGRDACELALFDLKMDISEKNNLLEKHPDIVARLAKMIEAKQKEIDESARPAAYIKRK